MKSLAAIAAALLLPASAMAWVPSAQTDDAGAKTAVSDNEMKTWDGKPLGAHTGLGGPYEELAARSEEGFDLTRRVAVKDYPPCSGPADDHCIQLYEPGVRTALADWNAPGGGLWTGSAGSATAMGGPYEPAEQAGTGGSVEETGYPPCSPGPGDDRCIQLYERGVTGAGN